MLLHNYLEIHNLGVNSMKRNLYLWQFVGFVMTVLGGTLLHFLYDLTNESVLVAPFSAVNESTWEHMKLMYFPLFVFALIQRRFFREYKSFWCIKLIGIITGLVLIPVLFCSTPTMERLENLPIGLTRQSFFSQRRLFLSWKHCFSKKIVCAAKSLGFHLRSYA